MHRTARVRVPFRYALVNGLYYNAPPIPSPKLLAQVLRQGGRSTAKILFNALIQVGRDPAAADRAVLSDIERAWRYQQLPRYRELVASARAEVETAAPRRVAELVDELGREAGTYLFYLAIVRGSAWKMEACLTRFTRKRYATIREEQSHDFTLAWPVLHRCAGRLGQWLADSGAIDQADDIFFGTRDQLFTALADPSGCRIGGIGERRETWRRQRRLAAPLTLGRPGRLLGDVIGRSVRSARGAAQIPEGALVGQPASAIVTVDGTAGTVVLGGGPDDSGVAAS